MKTIPKIIWKQCKIILNRIKFLLKSHKFQMWPNMKPNVAMVWFQLWYEGPHGLNGLNDPNRDQQAQCAPWSQWPHMGPMCKWAHGPDAPNTNFKWFGVDLIWFYIWFYIFLFFGKWISYYFIWFSFVFIWCLYDFMRLLCDFTLLSICVLLWIVYDCDVDFNMSLKVGIYMIF